MRRGGPVLGRGGAPESHLPSASVDSVAVEEQERERRRQVVEKFQKAPFEEIAAHCGARVSRGRGSLNPHNLLPPGEVDGGGAALNFAKPPSSFSGKAGGVFVLLGLQSLGCSCTNTAPVSVAGDAAAEQAQPDLRDHHTVSWGDGRARCAEHR